MVVHRFVFADHEVGFLVLDDSDRATIPDAFRAARFSVLFANRVMIDIAHHIDDLASHRFFGGVLFAMFSRIVRERERCGGK